MFNKSKIHRSGCNPRVIFYSLSSKGHEYNYGKPVLSITGKCSRHISQRSSEDRKLFSNIKHHPLPNSKRTINPIYADTQIKTFNNAKKYIWKNSTMDYTLIETKNKRIKPGIKVYNNKNKTSNELNNIKNNKKKLNNPKKSTYSFNIKNKYDYNSEILNLPGGTKRKVEDIKDDLNKNFCNKTKNLNSTAGCFRKRDFNNSKVSCLKSFSKNKSKYNNNNDIRNIIINMNNKDTISFNYYTNNNSINYKTNETTNDYSNVNDNNKYKYIKASEISKDNAEYEGPKKEFEVKNDYFYNDNKFKFHQPIKNIGILRNYIQDSVKNKNNDLITHYSRKRNNQSYNRVFNEVHQENPKYDLINYYGTNYSKRNYSQFELN